MAFTSACRDDREPSALPSLLIRNGSSFIPTGNGSGGDYIYEDYPDPDLEAVSSVEGRAALVALYSFTAAAALLGNSVVIVVLSLGRRSSRGLRVFLVNLAASDVTMALFSIPFTYTSFTLGRWIFAAPFCPVVHFMQHVSVTVSVYTLTAIGLDRYYAITYPLHPRWTKRYSLGLVAVIWMCAGTVFSAHLVFSSARPFEWAGTTHLDCRERWSEDREANETIGQLYTVLVFVVTFVQPLLVLVFFYSSIAVTLCRRSDPPGNADGDRDRLLLGAKVRVVKMLAVVVVAFAVCWLPLHIFMLLVNFNPCFSWAYGAHSGSTAFIVIAYICHWLAMAHSLVNPIIYCFMSDNFWEDLRSLTLRCIRRFSGSRYIRDRSAMNSVRSASLIMSFRKNSGSPGSVQVTTRRIVYRDREPSTRVTDEGGASTPLQRL